jgi:hypothetical protein
MRFTVLTAASALALGASSAMAALGNNGLFLEVWNGSADPAQARSYIKDLGISLDAFMAAPECFNYAVQDLSADPELQALASGGTFPPGTVWAVQAYNDDGYASLQAAGSSNDPANHTGMLSTVATPAELLDDVFSSYPAFSDPLEAMKGHLAAASVENARSFGAADPGYYQEDSVWNELMNNTVGFSSAGTLAGGGSLGMYFLTVDINDFFSGVVGRDGAPLGSWRFDGQQISFTSASSAQPSTCPATTQCELPWGGKLTSGQSATAYKDANSTDCEANKESRVCANGVLSGSYTQQSCAAIVPQSCDLPWGGTLASGQSVEAYQSASSDNCDAAKETRACDNGTLSGSYANASCVSTAPQACDLPWGGSLASGLSVEAYASASSEDCAAIQETRSCDNGTLSGSHPEPACTTVVAGPKSCALPWGGTLASGESVEAYQSATSIYCDSFKETRACQDGALSGSFEQPACALPTGSYLWMVAPNGGESWRTGIRQYIEWTSGGIPENKRLNLYFSEDGGKQWRLVKRGLRNVGHAIWKPGSKRVTEHGLMKLCVAKPGKSAALCDSSDQAFSVAD